MEEVRYLGLDYGEKRIGIAITDPLNLFVYPLTTLNNDLNFWKKFTEILNQYHVVKIILGYPLKENGEFSSSTIAVIEFKEKLEKKIDIPVALIDERYSSEIAKGRILQSVPSKRKRRDKSLLDKNAAAVILEDYLNTLRENKSSGIEK
jgi:putative Holliday junction resolvase